MNIENQVCALQQAKRLKELGIVQGKSLFVHLEDTQPEGNHIGLGVYYAADMRNRFDAYTDAELGVMLPAGYDTMYNTDFGWRCYNYDGEDVGEDYGYEYEAECRAAAIIFLLEQKLITAEEVNARLI